jgi:DNA-binding CsgD family transcriptional regulator
VSDVGTVARLGTSLTAAELRVLRAMKDADSERAAALALGLSRHTVHSLLANARSRLGVHTTRQAIAKAAI